MIYQRRILLCRSATLSRNLSDSWASNEGLNERPAVERHQRRDTKTQSIFLTRKNTLRLCVFASKGSRVQFEIADVADIVAVPHVTVVDCRAVDDRISLAELDLLDHLAGLDVVPEERTQIRVGDPQRIAFPSHAVRAIGRDRPGPPGDP